MPSKKTLREIAAELGMSNGDITRAKADGVNPYDREAMTTWKSNRNSYAPRGGEDKKPATELDPNAPGMTLEQIEEAASKPGLTKREVEVYKVQLEVMKAAAALRLARNQSIPRGEAKEHQAKTAHAVQAMLRRFELEIPALCLGLSISQSSPVVKEKCREIQSQVATMQQEFWTERPEI